ncbi:MAG: GTP 3',8-cyclase MoaA [Chloroflexota bacterium]|nr:GTP 3',8-cyclase MoaA [Chloroflexota bacterium]
MATQKTGLRDLFGRLLQDVRISVTDRCNFRCPYCMPAEIFGERYQFLPQSEILSFEEITRLAHVFVGLGVTKIRITGGEPLLRSNLPELIQMMSNIDGLEDLSLTTNGYLLPQMAHSLKEAGLNRVTISLDSLDDDVFGEMNGRGFGVDKILEAIDVAEKEELTPIKINTVVKRGVNDHTLMDLIEHFKGSNQILRLIEYMDVGTLNGWQMDEVVPSKSIVESINEKYPISPKQKTKNSETADRYQYNDGSGELGFISSVSEPFCASCTRARVSTDGKLFTCLFASDGMDLMSLVRDTSITDKDIENAITGVWENRSDQYSEERTAQTNEQSPSNKSKVEMYQIGG